MIHQFSTFAFGFLSSAVLIAPIAIRALRRREMSEAKALSTLAMQRGAALDTKREYETRHITTPNGGCYTVLSKTNDSNVIPLTVFDFRYEDAADKDFARISAEELCETLNDLQRWTN